MSITETVPCGKVYQQLRQVFPGGVNSPFRAFDLVGGTPRVLVRGEGCRVWDTEGREYIDLCCAWGPLVLGHAHPKVTQAVTEAAKSGAIFGAPNPWELEMARLVQRAMPSLEMLRFVNSGAEAVMSAVRVARGFTQREKIVKFEGCYHGHVACLDAVGREADEAGGCLALGAPRSVARDTLLATFNNVDSVAALFRQHPDEVAAVILEPITGSMGVIKPQPDFLQELKGLCHRHGALLIFDEVLTGFRVALGGAQALYDVQPDLTCLGKALGGGLPIGAYGGRGELMEQLSPLGSIYQAGTFCGNPVTMRAGIAALQEYHQPGFYEDLGALSKQLCEGLERLFPDLYAPYLGGMFSVGFGVTQMSHHQDAQKFDTKRFSAFFHALLEEGVYLPPSTFDAACVSSAHTQKDIEEVLRRAAKAWNNGASRRTHPT